MKCKRNSKLLVVVVIFLVYGQISRGEYDDWCLDYESRKCEKWKAGGQCRSPFRRVQVMIRRLCMETCNFCEPPSPEVCYDENHEVSKYGCCWDGINAATGPNGQGCPGN
ncbi:uncharacterized protein LOC110055534 [Orbicella faveolata]|uniref:uncharacterized protein LOC110055534 n=1 Tax=Orbicella faveolata TaxID=48498 RepID=UPI0009E234EC|nr:uncharacterized protein LOC110055534 [Orbicella faveolata]